jgi:hypothetical protein
MDSVLFLEIFTYIEEVPQGASKVCVAKIGKNLLNEEITPLLPTGIGERFSQTISNLGPSALLPM